MKNLDRQRKNVNRNVLIFLLAFLLGTPVVAQPFITTWVTDDTEITIPAHTSSGPYNYDVTWTNLSNAGVGDGSSNGLTGHYTISGLANGDTYEVAISGDFPRFAGSIFSETSYKLMSVEQWGSISWSSMYGAFSGCQYLVINATDAPDLANVADMTGMFRGASIFNSDIGNWDVSSVTTMRELFMNATSFNQDVSNWDVSNVTSMAHMFDKAESFNNGEQPLTWTLGTGTSSVTNMQFMFFGATSFNQDISSWDVSNVTNMINMFNGAVLFDQNIGSWDVSNVTTMAGIFQSTPFDQVISSWDVSNVTSMSSMFNNAQSFNNGGQPLTWTTSNVEDMTSMFAKAFLFNQDISSWDVGNVTSMWNMFSWALSFNQDISSWDVSHVTNMSTMFVNASSFNQNLEAWDVSNVTDMTSMFDYTNLSIGFYDKTLVGWNTLSVGESRIPTGIVLGAETLQYTTAGEPSRTNLISSYGWTISGDMFVSSPTPEIALYAGPDNTAPSITSGQSQAIDFGTTLQGSDLVRTFTIENIGSADLTITDITSSDPAFFITNSITTVTAGTTETFSITLSGATAGSFTADITITSGDADEGTFVFPVTGEIADPAPEIALYGGIDNTAHPITSGQSQAIDLGSTLQGNDLVQTFAIGNVGTTDLTITAITTNDPAYSITNSTATIAGGTTETFTLTLTGTTVGSFATTITITSNDADESTFVFPVTGEVVDAAPEIALYAGIDNTTPLITSNQSPAIDLGSTLQGNDLVQTFAIGNVGATDLTITAITSSDPAFSITSSIGTLPAGTTETFTITLAGAAAGSFTTEMTITSNDANEGTFIFPVTGEVISSEPVLELYFGLDNPRELVAANSSVDMGVVLQGTNEEFSFTIENTGTKTLNINSIDSSNPSFQVSSSLSEVAPGSSGIFAVTPEATSEGDFSFTLSILSNDPVMGLFQFAVVGTIELEEMEMRERTTNEMIFSDATIDFGTAQLGNPVTRSYVVFNPSQHETLSIEEIIIESEGFEITGNLSHILPNTSADLEIQQTASMEGSNTAEVTFVSNFADFTLFLRGEVIQDRQSLKVFNVVTPNGDGKHDFFKILGITNYPSNEVSVLNKAGMRVYHAEGYDNENVRFEGIGNQGRYTVLDPGTYYYVLGLGNGEKKSGYLQIIRN